MPQPALAEGLRQARAAHRRLRDHIDAFDVQVDGTDADPRLRSPWTHLKGRLRAHMDEEEQQLFPALEALAAGAPPSTGPWIGALEHLRFEVDELATLTDACRAAARDAGDLEDPLLALLDELEHHALAEQDRLYPAAAACLPGAPPAPPAGPVLPEGPDPLAALLAPAPGRAARPLPTEGLDPAGLIDAARAASQAGEVPVPVVRAPLGRPLAAAIRRASPSGRALLRWPAGGAPLDSLGAAAALLHEEGLRVDLLVDDPGALLSAALAWAAGAPVSGVVVGAHAGLPMAGLSAVERRQTTAVLAALHRALGSPDPPAAWRGLLLRDGGHLVPLGALVDLPALDAAAAAGPAPLLAALGRAALRRDTPRLLIALARGRELFPGAPGPGPWLRVWGLHPWGATVDRNS